MGYPHFLVAALVRAEGRGREARIGTDCHCEFTHRNRA
ncbi:protein of unknown function [Candidatus Hydrogenisulfobacillus filiaventi]|uniref:Uncharacterized protein n=1 Tax=Candidatus Hydrogenisulfobacillus filiaventi TaxID=2707344 RepID=A0A6F8ZFK6_9FIRM|nr:protein of unknown function [Candidatus Hydrogenisulfobacillus filiaventi]